MDKIFMLTLILQDMFQYAILLIPNVLIPFCFYLNPIAACILAPIYFTLLYLHYKEDML